MRGLPMQRLTDTLMTSTAAVAELPGGNSGTATEGHDDPRSNENTNSQEGDHHGHHGDHGRDRRDEKKVDDDGAGDEGGDSQGDDSSPHRHRPGVSGSRRQPEIVAPAWPRTRPVVRLLDHRDLEEKGIKYSKVQLWRKVKAGTFPAPIKIGAARNAWLESEIDGWIADRVTERDAGSKSA